MSKKCNAGRRAMAWWMDTFLSHESLSRKGDVFYVYCRRANNVQGGVNKCQAKHSFSSFPFYFNVSSSRVLNLVSVIEEITSCGLAHLLASSHVRRADTQGTVKISQQDIASHLGTTREVVSKLLKQFEKQMLLKTARGSITILSTRRLSRLGFE